MKAFNTKSSGAKRTNSWKQRLAPRESVLRAVSTRAWEQDEDLTSKDEHAQKKGHWTTFLLAFQALGIVYGDIGTSPLYVISTTTQTDDPNATTLDPQDVMGVTSLILWTLTAIVVLKYAVLVLRADDNGQGGTFALYSLLKRQAGAGVGGAELASDRHLTNYSRGPHRVASWKETLWGRAVAAVAGAGEDAGDWRQKFIQGAVRVLVVIGVGMIMGDGVLTPAVSVVSACEGLQTAFSGFTRFWIDLVAVLILAGLFIVQQFGTGTIGTFFSPVIAVWFAFNSGVGLYNIIVHSPSILKALSPHYWFLFFLRGKAGAWRRLGGVVLCITGAEALFADLGHFNRRAIQLSTFCLVWPALLLTYLGQGAYLLRNPDQAGTAFWSALPQGTFWPMFVVATAAAIIASQALISAVFQIVSQAIAQGFFPRFKIYHTSRKHFGQIYIPAVNYLIMVLCLVIVIVFKTSAALGNAYGLAVLVDMLLTTHFFSLVMITVWKLPLLLPTLFYLFFLPIEGLYLSSTLTKIPRGGWFSIMMSMIYASIMLLWSWGKGRKTAYFRRQRLRLDQMVALQGARDDQLSFTIAQQKLALQHGALRLKRVRGIGLYYSDDIHGVPAVLVQTVTRMPVVYEVNIFLTNRPVPIPEVLPRERLLVEQLGVTGFYHVIVRRMGLLKDNQQAVATPPCELQGSAPAKVCLATQLVIASRFEELPNTIKPPSTPRYGYAEKVDQGEAFLLVVLERLLSLLLRALEEELAICPGLRAKLAAPDIFSDEGTSMSANIRAQLQQSLLRRGDADLAVLPEGEAVASPQLQAPMRALPGDPPSPSTHVRTFGGVCSRSRPSADPTSSRPSISAPSPTTGGGEDLAKRESEEERARRKALSGPLPKVTSRPHLESAFAIPDSPGAPDSAPKGAAAPPPPPADHLALQAAAGMNGGSGGVGAALDRQQSSGHPPPALSRMKSLRNGVRVDDAGLARTPLDHLDAGPARPADVHAALEDAVAKLAALGEAPSGPDAFSIARAALLADEIRIVRHAHAQNACVYVMGRSHVRLRPLDFSPRAAGWLLRRYCLELPFKILVSNFSEDADVAYGVPASNLLEIGLPFDIADMQ